MRPKRSEAGFVTLIELLVVTVIILVAVYMLYGQSPTGVRGAAGVGGVAGTSDTARTTVGATLDQARALECRENLRGIRQTIETYRISGGPLPQTLEEMRLPTTKCPVSGNPYVYDPQTGTVHCTTPGHDDYPRGGRRLRDAQGDDFAPSERPTRARNWPGAGANDLQGLGQRVQEDTDRESR